MERRKAPHGVLIHTKLRPRVAAGGALPRRQVLARLAHEPVPTLTLISAAVGYGKTTTMSLWWHQLREQGAVAAWLSLDANDASPAAVLSYLIASFDHAGVAMPELMTAARTKLTDTPVSEILAALINNLSAREGRLFLFLDDYHCVASPAVDGLLSDLIDYLCGRVHFVLSTRTRPSLNIARQRAMGDIRELYARDLRFDSDESEHFFGYSDAATVQLTEVVDGWPAAMQLGRLWLDKRPATGAGALAFTGRSTDLAAYLLEQVFSGLDEELQRKLQAISILDRFNGDLVDSICQTKDGWRLVDTLEADNLFITALDDKRYWFALHQLFREFLLERLRRARDAQWVTLHARAARWFVQHGYTDEALQQARNSGDIPLLADVLERIGGWTVAFREGVQPLAVLLSHPREEVLKYPVIGLAQVYVLLQSGEVSQARALFAQLAEHCFGDSAGAAAQLSILFLQNLLHLYEGVSPDVDSIERFLSLLADRPQEGFPTREMSDILKCYLHFQNASFEASILTGRASIEAFLREGVFYGAFFVDCYIGFGLMALGRLHEAAAAFADGMQIASSHYSIHCNQVKIARILLAEIAYERNRIDEARSLLEQPVDEMWRSGSWFHVLVSGAMTRTAILTLDGRTDEALAFLDQIEHYADRQGIPRLHSALLVHRARLLLRAGREEQAAALVNGEEFQAIIDADADAALAPIREPALALRARLGHDAATAEQAIASLQRIADAAAATGHLRREVPARLALAVSIARLHGAEAAFAQLTEILRKSEAGEFVRSFLDEGEPLTALLQALVSARAAFPQACIERAHVLLADLERAKLATGSNAGSDDHALSQREREVLELLAKGMSSKEMAGALRVSAGTVKVHRKRLYRKLGAHNRSAALAVARSRKLVQLGVQDPLSLQAAGHARRRGGVNENGVAGSGNAVFDNSGSSGAPPLADDVTSDRSDPRSSPSSRP